MHGFHGNIQRQCGQRKNIVDPKSFGGKKVAVSIKIPGKFQKSQEK